MTKQNPSNPYTRDESHTKKDVPMPFKKAKVLDVKSRDENGFHIVRIRCYGDSAPYDAPVLAPMEGCIWVPERDSDVIVLFTDEDKPVVIGQWYALDRVEDGEVLLPPYEPGDIRLGNSTGSHVTVHNDGSIDVSTDGDEPVNVDIHAASIYLGTNTVFGSSGPYKVDLDATNFDTASLHNGDSITVKEGGVYDLRAKVRVQDAGQNNVVEVQIRVDGQEVITQNTDHTADNVPIGVETSGYRELESGDEVELWFDHTGSGTVTIEDEFTELSIARQGI